MARYTAHALVIGVHPWGDADKVVELFTAEKGRVRAAAFGSRRRAHSQRRSSSSTSLT